MVDCVVPGLWFWGSQLWTYVTAQRVHLRSSSIVTMISWQCVGIKFLDSIPLLLVPTVIRPMLSAGSVESHTTSIVLTLFLFLLLLPLLLLPPLLLLLPRKHTTASNPLPNTTPSAPTIHLLKQHQRGSILGKNLGPPYPCAVIHCMSILALGQDAQSLRSMYLPALQDC